MYNGSGCVYTALSTVMALPGPGHSSVKPAVKDVSTLHFHIPTGASALTET